MASRKPTGGLTAWFGKGKKGDWVDIGAPKKKGKFQACVESLLKVKVKESTRNAYQDPRPNV